MNGVQPPKTIRARFVSKIKAALADRQDPEMVAAAIARCVAESISPASFEEVLWKIQGETGQKRTPRDRQLLDEFLQEHDGAWPTGTRMVRGTHSATYVEDALGYDACPYPVAWSRPKRADVLAALEKRRER